MPENANSEVRPSKGKRYGPEFRLRTILPVLRFRLRLAADDRIAFLTPKGDLLHTVSELVAHQARLASISSRTVWRWYLSFAKFGFDSLARKTRRDAGVSRALCHRGLAQAFVAEKKVAGWSPHSIHRALVQLWPRLYPNAAPCPCYKVILQFVYSLPSIVDEARP